MVKDEVNADSESVTLTGDDDSYVGQDSYWAIKNVDRADGGGGGSPIKWESLCLRTRYMDGEPRKHGVLNKDNMLTFLRRLPASTMSYSNIEYLINLAGLDYFFCYEPCTLVAKLTFYQDQNVSIATDI